VVAVPQEVSGKKMEKKKAIYIALVITVIVLVVPLTIIISKGTSSNAAVIWNIGSISFTDLLTDSMSSIYRMFVALALSFIVAIYCWNYSSAEALSI